MNFTNPNRPETFFVCPPQGETILLLPRVCPCDISAVLLRCVWSILNPSLGQQYENNARWVHTRDSDMISAQATKKIAGRKKKISSPKSPSLLFLGRDRRQVHYRHGRHS
jgi:hypothetical protein